MNIQTKLDIGRVGENLAVEYLQERGYRIIERNWRTRAGEIDIIALDGRIAVGVEVKTRSTLFAGHPFEAITGEKIRRLRKLILAWCHQTKPGVYSVRVDAVSIVLGPGKNPQIEHIRAIGS